MQQKLRLANLNVRRDSVDSSSNTNVNSIVIKKYKVKDVKHSNAENPSEIQRTSSDVVLDTDRADLKTLEEQIGETDLKYLQTETVNDMQ